MTMQDTASTARTLSADYDKSDIQVGVGILENFPDAVNSREKGIREPGEAAKAILNGHPYHEGLNSLLTKMAGTARVDRLDALTVIYREFATRPH